MESVQISIAKYSESALTISSDMLFRVEKNSNSSKLMQFTHNSAAIENSNSSLSIPKIGKKSKFDSNLNNSNDLYNDSPFAPQVLTSQKFSEASKKNLISDKNLNFSLKKLPYLEPSAKKLEGNSTWLTEDCKFLAKLNSNCEIAKKRLSHFNDSAFVSNF